MCVCERDRESRGEGGKEEKGRKEMGGEGRGGGAEVVGRERSSGTWSTVPAPVLRLLAQPCPSL